MFASLMHRPPHAGRDIDVWLNPASGISVSDLTHELGSSVHLVVVPKTGSRHADIAVLQDPDPNELETVARVLTGIPLLATTTAQPTSALRAAASRVGARLVPAPTPRQLLREIRRTCAEHRLRLTALA